MQLHRPAAERLQADHGWLRAAHTFSFAGSFDPAWVQFGPLRVLNEDRVRGGGGFGAHPHQDMEIVTYVLSGGLRHQDSMGNGDVVRAGDVQRMSAGTGVVHSEVNASATDDVHLLQMWVFPRRNGDPPGWEQTHVPVEAKRDRLRLLVSPGGEQETLWIGADARLYASVLSPGAALNETLGRGRQQWLQLVRGRLTVNGRALEAGDGLGLVDEAALTITNPDPEQDAEFVLWDLPSNLPSTS